MNCPEIQDRLSALIDGDLPASERHEVEQHLTDCAVCRSASEILCSAHQSMADALQAERLRAHVVADRVLKRLSESPIGLVSEDPLESVQRARAASLIPLLTHIAAAAAGVLVAFAFLNRPDDPAQDTVADDGAAMPDHAVVGAGPIARIVHVTGPISFRGASAHDWQMIPVDRLPAFQCPSDTALKTEAGALCELETTAGCKLRLNEATEVVLQSEHELELVDGQVWCSSPSDAVCRVRAREEPAGVAQRPSGTRPAWSLSCSEESQCLASALNSGELQIVAAAGLVELVVGNERQQLSPGSCGTLQSGQLMVSDSAEQRLLAERWMQPLLTLSGHQNPELTRRVDALLARIGQAKLSHLFAQDIRNLGEYGALPVLRFVQSDPSREDPDRRQAAMEILADTAPVWMTPELIQLLDDDDHVVRVNAARALTRLTGDAQGINPTAPPDNDDTWAGAMSGWSQWWLNNQFSCPPSPGGAKSARQYSPLQRDPVGPGNQYFKARN